MWKILRRRAALKRRRLADVELTVLRPCESAESSLKFYFLAQQPRYVILLYMLYLLICYKLLSERK